VCFRFETRARFIFFSSFIEIAIFSFLKNSRGGKGQEMMLSSDARALSLFFQRAFLSTDIRKIKNTSGEQETAENTRWRIMIRCDVLNFFFFFEFWGCANLCTFPIISLSLFSENRRLVVFFQRKKRLLFFRFVVADTIRALFFLLSFHFYINSDGTSYAQAMCAPKLNPLIVSGITDFLPSSRFFE
jgi:hypothetical protein